MAKGSGKRKTKRATPKPSDRARKVVAVEKALAAAMEREAKAASRLQAARTEVETLRLVLADLVPTTPAAAEPAPAEAVAKPVTAKATPAKAAAAPAPRRPPRRRPLPRRPPRSQTGQAPPHDVRRARPPSPRPGSPRHALAGAQRHRRRAPAGRPTPEHPGSCVDLRCGRRRVELRSSPRRGRPRPHARSSRGRVRAAGSRRHRRRLRDDPRAVPQRGHRRARPVCVTGVGAGRPRRCVRRHAATPPGGRCADGGHGRRGCDRRPAPRAGPSGGSPPEPPRRDGRPADRDVHRGGRHRGREQ